MAAADSVNEICSLRIELCDSAPLIWRELEVPTSITLKALHDVVQAAMGWFDLHLWEFRHGKQRYGLPMDEDWGTEPRIDAAKVRLHDVLTPRRTVMTYIYDYGDDWHHKLILTRIRQGEAGCSYPRYLAGENNGPPEDCGGIPGFRDLLDAAADPKRDDHAESVRWLDNYDPKAIDEDQIRISLTRIARRRNAAVARVRRQPN